MKRKIALILTTLFTCSSVFADLVTALDQGCFRAKKTPPFVKVIKKHYAPKAAETNTSTGVGFSLYNKSNDTVFIAVKNRSIESEGKAGRALSALTQTEWVVEIPVGQMANLELNTKYPTTLKILRDCPDKGSCPLGKKNTYKTYEFTPNKTIYVTWNPTNQAQPDLYPQSGPTMAGLVNPKITDVCFDTSNNVSQLNIIQKQK